MLGIIRTEGISLSFKPKLEWKEMVSISSQVAPYMKEKCKTECIMGTERYDFLVARNSLGISLKDTRPP